MKINANIGTFAICVLPIHKILEMHQQNIPYRIYGGLSFYQRKEIKDIIAYFRVIANRDDEKQSSASLIIQQEELAIPRLVKLPLLPRSTEVSFGKSLLIQVDIN